MKLLRWLKAKWNNVAACLDLTHHSHGMDLLFVFSERLKWKGAEPLLMQWERDEIAAWRPRLG